jgi:hypothetical protein
MEDITTVIFFPEIGGGFDSGFDILEQIKMEVKDGKSVHIGRYRYK